MVLVVKSLFLDYLSKKSTISLRPVGRNIYVHQVVLRPSFFPMSTLLWRVSSMEEGTWGRRKDEGVTTNILARILVVTTQPLVSLQGLGPRPPCHYSKE